MAKSRKFSADRRKFLKGAAVAGAATLAAPGETAVARPAARATAPLQDPRAETGTPPEADVLTTDHCGSDFMVDVIKSLDIEYFCANPGSSFRALHESIVNYGGNQKPEFITCCHEESSVAMAHAYSKIEGKPIGVMAHGTVGLQHAAMGIYNAYCDRVPVFIVVGNSLDATQRRPGVEWEHSVQDAASIVRDFVKWDDTPISLGHFAESAARAYKIAMTPPMEPVLLVADSDLQERPLFEKDKLRVQKATRTSPPQGDSGAVAEAAKLLVAAQNPVIVADRAARTAAGMKYLMELAETLQAPVLDQGGRMNFPTRHKLNLSGRGRPLIAEADVILGLELTDFWGTVNSYRDQLERTSRRITKPGSKLISITAGDLYIKSNYQDFERYPEIDIAMAADAEATLPALTEAVKRLITPDRKNAFQARGAKLAAAHDAAAEQARKEAAYGWDASPISTARMSAELWAQIKNEDWSLVSNGAGGWPQRLWNFDKYYQHIGGSGGAGVGYGAPASVGGALANRKYGRLSVSIQNDGDLMYAPGVLWTASHHRIPLLSVMHNNRAYHQEVMHLQRMGNRHNRGIDRAYIGTTIEDPNIDYAKLAQSMSWYAEGPITDPKDLGPAIKRALAAVKRGEPALVDVVSQPR
ncbi:MAG: thiamine pyrophosphate-binding protein [Acidobacteria bacterium]|nr:MAG: thiamine pyrophosphate-binding protein [Acidobacteriota bacterium]